VTSDDFGCRGCSVAFRQPNDVGRESGIQRPCLGFIVEGYGELNSYRSIVQRVLERPIGHIPVSNGEGCGNLVKHLESKLRDLVKTWHPAHIIVTLDGRDLCDLCADDNCPRLRENLQGRADTWLAQQHAAGALVPLPESIVVVLQDRAFESWLIADLDGLRLALDFVHIENEPKWTNVDAQIRNPGAWLDDRLLPGVRLKDPMLPKNLMKYLTPTAMAQNSRSFRKFWKEVARTMQAEHC
jgi:hypothetical protein